MRHWTKLNLTDSYIDIDPRSPRGVEVLQEYRDTDQIHGIWLCDLERLKRYAEAKEDPSDYGPSPEEIDWSGFPE
jgi:hypothetical protein